MTAIPIPLDIPDPAALRRLREEIGLSQDELAEELGFKENGAAVVRCWEQGSRLGKEFGPTPLAWRCFRLIVVICRAHGLAAHEVKAYLRANLSERLA